LHTRPLKTRLRLQKTGRFFIVFLLASMPLLFGAVHPIVVGLYTALMLTSCGGWLLVNSRKLPANLCRSRWIMFALLFIAWALFSTIPLPMGLLELLSPARAASLQAVNQLAGTDIRWAPLNYHSSAGLLFALFLFALLLYGLTLDVLLSADRRLLKKIVYTCIGLAILEAAYGMLQVFNPQLGVLWLSGIQAGKGMARGTIIYKNQYASLLNMCWPLAVGAALFYFKQAIPVAQHRRHKRKHGRALAEMVTSRRLQGFLFLFVASCIMLAVLFSQSRGGIIAMVLVMVLLLFLAPLTGKNKIRLSSCLLLFTLAYGSAIGFSSIIDHFMVIGGSGLARINIYLASLPILYDHSIAGIGLESYRLLSPVYLKNFPENILFDRAHNEYLELTIELGLPMALFFFGALFTALYGQAQKIVHFRRKKLSELDFSNIVALVAFCGVAGFLFHGLADFGWHLPANLLYFVTLTVLVHHGSRTYQAEKHRSSAKVQ